MEKEIIIVAVSLCGNPQDQQPDPIVLPPDDENWVHFSTLILSLYKTPTSAINVKYLDDDGDWVDMGSDAELSEALRMTRASGEVLQVRVYPVRENGWPEHAYMKSSKSLDFRTPLDQGPYNWIPTTDHRYESSTDGGSQDPSLTFDTSETFLVVDRYPHCKWAPKPDDRCKSEEPLVYPNPPASSNEGVMVTSVGGTQYTDAQATQPWLVYPYPDTQAQPTQPQKVGCECIEVKTNTADIFAQPYPFYSGNVAKAVGTSTNTNRPAAVSRTSSTSSSSPKTPAPSAAGNKTTLLAAATAWQEASKLPPKEKVKFLRRLASADDAPGNDK
ncbi:hypothetical protein EGW08_005510, partial [Elysia chlorotica]